MENTNLSDMIVAAITAFHGRHEKVEMALRCFLNQDYTGKTYLILYNNSPVPMSLGNFEYPQNKVILLINNNIDRETGREYDNTGAIFRDALSYVPDEVKIVTHFDSDDIFLPNHVSNGVRGMTLAYHQNKLAYKPDKSYFLYGREELTRVGNTMEPSIFVDAKYLRKQNYALEVDPYHQGWLNPLLKDNKVFVEDKEDNSTFIYNWEENHGTHKLSGGGNSAQNFFNHRRYSTDYGDMVLTPTPQFDVLYYYNLVKQTNVKKTTNYKLPATGP